MTGPKVHKARSSRVRLRLKKGQFPGSLDSAPDAQPVTLRYLAYGPDQFVEKVGATLADVDAAVGKWPVLWLNVTGTRDTELVSQVGDRFQIHRLALEDVTHTPQRPKLDHYGSHYFLIQRFARWQEGLDTEQISLFLAPGVVVTFQEREGDSLAELADRIRTGRGRVRKMGADYLAYAVMDVIVDSYFPVLEEVGDALERAERAVVDDPAPETSSQIHSLRRELLGVRRALWPQGEVISSLLRDGDELVGEETRLFLRDCQDHVRQLLEVIETYHELSGGLLDAYHSSLSHRMNEVMRFLTVFSTLFMPLSFLASLWGMNFHTGSSPFNMPELSWYFGYPFALGIMATAALGLLVYFRRRGWL